ncbi:NAD(P)H oxidoreductase [Salibacterium aidingense]|uniref:NAD(P)H oxidoreductase n=1 Tax=Salibacterium aidingense TaxID=384933 RepID=UPI0003F7C1B9|nr:NAD(P)H oxidoreductase [Salibacterium aidingense]
MKVLTVIAHPRRDSLTFAAANCFIEGLREAGHETEVLDLYRTNFNPMLWEADEPDWLAASQQYSPEVEWEMERMTRQDGLAFVFPLWWWSMPAVMKGYIDRVWNYGFAYGSGKLTHQHVLWLTLAGAPVERFEKRGYDKMIDHYFNGGLADYCGISSSNVKMLYETIRENPEKKERLLDSAYLSGRHYGQ